MSSGRVRRGQLITPFGVGAMNVSTDGIALISGGLDHWYEPEGLVLADQSGVAVEEFIVHEWRLERLLKVNHFRLPPDYRKAQRGVNIPNTSPCLFCASRAGISAWIAGASTSASCQSAGRSIVRSAPGGGGDGELCTKSPS
jgi:hypothetical protein